LLCFVQFNLVFRPYFCVTSEAKLRRFRAASRQEAQSGSVLGLRKYRETLILTREDRRDFRQLSGLPPRSVEEVYSSEPYYVHELEGP